MGFSGMGLKGHILWAAMVVSALPGAGWAQSGTQFEDPSGKFKITLLGEWRAVSYSDAVGRPKTEFVYRDRREGLLRISKESLDGGSLESTVRSEEENLRTYRPGFERAATEPFGGGTLRGLRFSFFATEGRRPVASTYYYLEDGSSVWVLRFTGKRGSLDANRNLVDQIARSFQPLR
jgi:hypothetical protein